MAVLDEPNGSREPHIVGDKDRLFVAYTQRLQPPQPAMQRGSDLVQGQHRMAAQTGRCFFRIRRCRGFGVVLESREPRSRQTEANRVRMSAKAAEKLFATSD